MKEGDEKPGYHPAIITTGNPGNFVGYEILPGVMLSPFGSVQRALSAKRMYGGSIIWSNDKVRCHLPEWVDRLQ